MSMEKYGADPKTLQRAELASLKAKIARFRMEKTAAANRDAEVLERRVADLEASLSTSESTTA
jgi:hypothetical protein